MRRFDQNMTKEQCWYQMGQECQQDIDAGKTKNEMFEIVAVKYGYSSSSVRHFDEYFRAVNRITEMAPRAADLLLQSKVMLSIHKTEFLAKQPPEVVEEALTRLEEPDCNFREVFPDYKDRTGIKKRPRKPRTTVKDTPAYDPDAQVTGLINTIPSWMSVIDRVSMTADFNGITVNAHRKLKKALDDLKNLTEMTIITEESIQ